MQRRCWIPLLLLVGCSSDRDLPGDLETTESGESSSTTTGESTGSDTEAAETSDTEAEATETSTGADCVPLEYEVVQHDALTQEHCANGNEEAVFQNKAEVEAWLAAVCGDPMGCLGDCDPPPNVPWNKTTLLLASASAPAGSSSTFTWDIYDCGDHVEAHFTFHAWGPELAFYQRQETVAIDKIDVPVDFYGESAWTPDP